MNKGKVGLPWTAALLLVSAAAWGTFFFFMTENKFLGCVIHVLCFAPFTFFLLKSMEAWWGKRIPLVARCLAPMGIALFLEYIQRWTPPHNPEWQGLTASLLGVVVGVVAHSATRRFENALNHGEHREHGDS